MLLFWKPVQYNVYLNKLKLLFFFFSSSGILLQYYGHREKLRLIGREDDLEKLNRVALKIAREVADETGTLMAGGICNTGLYVEGDEKAAGTIKEMFKVIFIQYAMSNIKIFMGMFWVI
jgi:hypothetical protein